MKKIKRTIIKITQRELIIFGRLEQHGEELIERCPICYSPINEQKSLEAKEKTPLELPTATETNNK